MRFIWRMLDFNFKRYSIYSRTHNRLHCSNTNNRLMQYDCSIEWTHNAHYYCGLFSTHPNEYRMHAITFKTNKVGVNVDVVLKWEYRNFVAVYFITRLSYKLSKYRKQTPHNMLERKKSSRSSKLQGWISVVLISSCSTRIKSIQLIPVFYYFSQSSV